jgi:hypothetical protein
MISMFAKALSMLAAIFTLVAVGATPASADTGYFWAENRASGCLDFSGHFGFRVFPCNGDSRYQYLHYQRIFPSNPDIYQIRGNSSSGASSVCIRANGNGNIVSSVACNYYNSQFFVIRYANGQP